MLIRHGKPRPPSVRIKKRASRPVFGPLFLSAPSVASLPRPLRWSLLWTPCLESLPSVCADGVASTLSACAIPSSPRSTQLWLHQNAAPDNVAGSNLIRSGITGLTASRLGVFDLDGQAGSLAWPRKAQFAMTIWPARPASSAPAPLTAACKAPSHPGGLHH